MRLLNKLGIFKYMAEDPGAGGGGVSDAGGGQGDQGGQSQQSNSFYSGFVDEGVRTWTEAKGFKDAESLAHSALNLEKLIGAEKAGKTITMLGENATPEEIAAFREKIGVPKTAAEYKLPVPEGQDGKFAETASTWFHEAGLTPKQAESLSTKWNEFQAAQQQQYEAQRAQQSDIEYKEWEAAQGSALAQNLELGKRAVRQFGLDAKDEQGITMSDKIETALGTKAFMEFIHKLGTGLGEAQVYETKGGGNGVLTPNQAQAKITSLKNDPAWADAYLKGDKNKMAEMQTLMAQAYPEAKQ